MRSPARLPLGFLPLSPSVRLDRNGEEERNNVPFLSLLDSPPLPLSLDRLKIKEAFHLHLLLLSNLRVKNCEQAWDRRDVTECSSFFLHFSPSIRVLEARSGLVFPFPDILSFPPPFPPPSAHSFARQTVCSQVPSRSSTDASLSPPSPSFLSFFLLPSSPSRPIEQTPTNRIGSRHTLRSSAYFLFPPSFSFFLPLQ